MNVRRCHSFPHSSSDKKKWNESGFRPPLCTYRLSWARRTSWAWWDDWDDTVLQTQDSKFEPWRSEAEHATSRSRRLPTILTSSSDRPTLSWVVSATVKCQVGLHIIFRKFLWDSIFHVFDKRVDKAFCWAIQLFITLSSRGACSRHVGSDCQRPLPILFKVKLQVRPDLRLAEKHYLNSNVSHSLVYCIKSNNIFAVHMLAIGRDGHSHCS